MTGDMVCLSIQAGVEQLRDKSCQEVNGLHPSFLQDFSGSMGAEREFASCLVI